MTDYVITCEEIIARLDSMRQPDDPLVRAALSLAMQPWLNGIYHGQDLMRWGLFATSVQGVADRLWPGPPSVVPVVKGPEFTSAAVDEVVVRLAEAVAELFWRASLEQAGEGAWEYAAAATQLKEAALELR